MMRKFLGAAIATMALAGPAMADGKIYVQLPDLSDYTGQAAEDYLHEVVLANVVSSNCAGFEITEEEWSLLTDSADILAKQQLKLDTNSYDRDYYGPAFAALDEADTCDTAGPNVQVVLDQLVAAGGSRTALPDQEAAYTEWRAMQDRWDAAEAGATEPAGKIKTK